MVSQLREQISTGMSFLTTPTSIPSIFPNEFLRPFLFSVILMSPQPVCTVVQSVAATILGHISDNPGISWNSIYERVNTQSYGERALLIDSSLKGLGFLTILNSLKEKYRNFILNKRHFNEEVVRFIRKTSLRDITTNQTIQKICQIGCAAISCFVGALLIYRFSCASSVWNNFSRTLIAIQVDGLRRGHSFTVIFHSILKACFQGGLFQLGVKMVLLGQASLLMDSQGNQHFRYGLYCSRCIDVAVRVAFASSVYRFSFFKTTAIALGAHFIGHLISNRPYFSLASSPLLDESQEAKWHRFILSLLLNGRTQEQILAMTNEEIGALDLGLDLSSTTNRRLNALEGVQQGSWSSLFEEIRELLSSQTLQLRQEDIIEKPVSVLSTIVGALDRGKLVKIQLEGSLAVDAGGVFRDVISFLCQKIFNSDSPKTFQQKVEVDQEIVTEPGVFPLDVSEGRLVGSLMAAAWKSKNQVTRQFYIGNIFHKKVYEGLLLLDKSDNNQTILIKLYALFLTQSTQKALLSFLKQKGLSEQDKGEINIFLEEDETNFEDRNKVLRLLEARVRERISQNQEVPYIEIFRGIYAIASRLMSRLNEEEWRIIKSLSPHQLQEQLEGISITKESMKNVFENNARDDHERGLYDHLMTWIDNAELKDLTRLCRAITGNLSLPTSFKMKVLFVSSSPQTKFFKSSTCFYQFKMHVHPDDPIDSQQEFAEKMEEFLTNALNGNGFQLE